MNITTQMITLSNGGVTRGRSVKLQTYLRELVLHLSSLTKARPDFEITNIEFSLRGYSDIIEKLRSLGADITLVED